MQFVPWFHHATLAMLGMHHAHVNAASLLFHDKFHCSHERLETLALANAIVPSQQRRLRLTWGTP